jgi:hypothetical protein
MWDYCHLLPIHHSPSIFAHSGIILPLQGGGPGRAARRRAPCRERLRGEVAGGGAAGDGAQEEVGSWSSAWGPGMGGFWWILVTGTVEFGLTHSRNGWEESPGVDGDGDLFPQPACSKIVSPMVRLLRRSHRPAFLTFQRGAVGFASGLSGCG